MVYKINTDTVINNLGKLMWQDMNCNYFCPGSFEASGIDSQTSATIS
jgi:hypothetical protein